MVIWPIRQLGRVLSQMSKAGVSIERVKYIMNSELESDRVGAGEPDMKQDICFNHVSFSFGDNQILDDVSFRVPAGTTLGVLGSTGSGKSTLINLLIRMYELGEGDGSITIGGVDIRDIKASWLRKNIGIVLQEPYLFSRTLRENIGIGVDHANMDTIREAARIASLLHTIEDFTKGFDTEVGERGVTLSGGQKQRTAIAQMIVGDTPVMVFDDSLSAVDAETDARIRDALRERNAETTTILVAHRITTLMNADQIIGMDRGRILESGTHEELLALGGVYRKIYDIQTEGGDYDAE
jgi:ATP-binding cassette subfamily B protein